MHDMAGKLVFVPKPRMVLAACPPSALPALERALGAYVSLVHVTSLDAAHVALRTNPRIGLIICGIYFDESRMYELLGLARDEWPRLPFVCVRVLDTEIPRISREALRIAAEQLGAAQYVDLPDLISGLGVEGADSELRHAVLSRLPAGQPGIYP
jgi:hypothetical protein